MTRLLAAAFTVTGGLLAAGSAATGGSCVACHETVPAAETLQHDFAEWRGSVHARSGVSCDACHGGDAASEEAAAAHRGILPSTDERSRVYFTRVPETCGACHATELRAFSKSAHSKELLRSGRGPNCVTCHGSMANLVLEPKELERACTLCHRRPTQAYASLLSLNNASALIRKAEGVLAEVRAAGAKVAAQEEALAKAKELHRGALEDWHTFRMDEVIKTSQEVARRTADCVSELRIKGIQKDDKPRR